MSKFSVWLVKNKQTTTTATTHPAPLQMPFLLLPFLLVSLINSAIGAKVRISIVDELIQFKDNVNGGTTYSGTTVFLDSDLSLAEVTLEPIGNSTSNYFLGTFDG